MMANLIICNGNIPTVTDANGCINYTTASTSQPDNSSTG